MKNVILAIVAAICFTSVTTFAANDTSCNAGGACPQGGTGGQGGNGGQGGAGGVGNGGAGGSLSNLFNASGIGTRNLSPSADSHNTNLNTNVNTQGQQQGQGQLQGQQQGQQIKNAGNSKSTSGAVSVQGQTADNNGNNWSFTEVHPDRLMNVPSVADPFAGNPTAPCRISIGATLSVMGGGGGIAGSTLDEGCDTWRDVAGLSSLNEREAALARACMKPEVAKALGNKCKQEKVVENKKTTFTSVSDTSTAGRK